MLIVGHNRFSQPKTCFEAAHHFILSEDEAIAICDRTETTIRENWDVVCEEADFTAVDKALMWERQFLNPFSTEQ